MDTLSLTVILLLLIRPYQAFSAHFGLILAVGLSSHIIVIGLSFLPAVARSPVFYTHRRDMLTPSIYLTYQTTAKTGVKLSLASQNLPLLIMIETGLKQKHQRAVRATEETWLSGL